MRTFARSALFVLQFAVLGLAIAFVVSRVWPQRFAAAAAPTPVSAPAATAPGSYRAAVDKAGPSVVSIYTQRVVAEQAYRSFTDPTLSRYNGVTLGPTRKRLERSLGSGVIVGEDGYVLTNHHVVAGADDILIGLWDGRITSARIIGVDQETDLAVIKIEGARLPAAHFAEADALRAGDVVLAIGNPYGLSQTVTLGIVSATGRNQLSLSRYEDFIQTDAAINSGNSGGALVNAEGALVGINTAVFGTGLGISFAIPAASARRVLEQIVQNGEVIRGWMGAEYAGAPASPAAEGSVQQRGAQIALLLPDGPADQAGLKPGDVVVEFNGQAVEDEGDLRSREAALAPATKVQVRALRVGVEFVTEVELIRRPRQQR
ncbi:MAG: trypsin-like peptidase domain-containing protein [Xanthomonadales bacterium]|jgi:serine protease DegQ|nr:trypsin-like peptidase domain-containing protein [Xanthomonadales bacterium]MBK7145954.1 trypsin-like peptidase domain-containing protein [Xanthomonadales bacterium]MCC6562472.1 trypsin-like peptidase domain-containing protein [Xanthomonadales bacterium]